jgi:ABC-type transporter Mla MlaB component
MKKVKKATSPKATRTRKRAARTSRSRVAPPRAASFTLACECLVSDAGPLKASLAELLSEAQPVTLEVHALQRIDTAALQLLAAFVRERDSNGRAVEWRGSSPALWTAARLLGVTSHLKLPAQPESLPEQAV